MTQKRTAVVDGKELGYSNRQRPKLGSGGGAQRVSAGGRGGRKCSPKAVPARMLRMRARVPSSVRDLVPRGGGAGPPRRKGVGWAGPGGGGGGCARARGCERGTPRGPGRAVGTTDGDDGRGDGRRRAGGGGGRRGRGRRGSGCGPGRLSAEGRWPGQQVLGKPGDGVPAGFGAGLAGQALQEGGFARPWGPGATRGSPAQLLASRASGRPSPRAPRGTTKAGAWPATPPPSALGARAPGAPPGPRGRASGSSRTAGESHSSLTPMCKGHLELRKREGVNLFC